MQLVSATTVTIRGGASVVRWRRAGAATSDGWRQSRSSAGSKGEGRSSSRPSSSHSTVQRYRGVCPPAGRPSSYHEGVLTPPDDAANWVGLSGERLPVEAALLWTQTPECGGQVLFTGTVRDHAEGRTGVDWLEYEAYTEHVEPRLLVLCDEIRARWPDVGRIVLLHRVGRIALTEVAVVVVVGSPHRPDAFAAARFAIDSLKASVPIWKKESWEGGEGWGLGAEAVTEVGQPS